MWSHIPCPDSNLGKQRRYQRRNGETSKISIKAYQGLRQRIEGEIQLTTGNKRFEINLEFEQSCPEWGEIEVKKLHRNNRKTNKGNNRTFNHIQSLGSVTRRSRWCRVQPGQRREEL